MSEKDNFVGGFLLGTLVGGVVGGVLGTLIASRNNNNQDQETRDSLFKLRKQPDLDSEESIEEARLNLESKINQLNSAIDDVRLTLLHNANTKEKELEMEE
jgi:gas vesicle protein